jgi:hypothetical protein
MSARKTPRWFGLGTGPPAQADPEIDNPKIGIQKTRDLARDHIALTNWNIFKPAG